MNRLFKLIPPLSSDYAGVCSVLFETNSLNILYTPGGCIHPIVEVDEIREFDNTLLFSSTLKEVEVIAGAEDQFMAKIQELLIANSFNVDFISIIGTPVSAITGVNFQRMMAELEKTTGLPVVVFHTSGFESYVVGIYNALRKLGEKFIAKQAKNKKLINIIGYSPLSLGHIEHLDEFLQVIKDCGLEVAFFSSTRSSKQEIKDASKAELNFVLSPDGLGLAEYLEKEFEIPFILQIPIGLSEMQNLIHLLEKKLGIAIEDSIKEKYKLDESVTHFIGSNNKVLVIGEPLFSIAIRKCLEKDFGVKQITLVSQINNQGKERQVYGSNIFSQINFLADEEDVRTCMIEADIVIADPLYENLLMKEGRRQSFIPFPYVALSGREFANMNYEYIGRGGFDYIKKMSLRSLIYYILKLKEKFMLNKKNVVKKILLIFLVVLTLALIGCSSNQSAQETKEVNQNVVVKQKVIIDTAGNEVKLKEGVEKIAIVPIPWASIVYAVEGAGKRIAGMHPSAKGSYNKSILSTLAPELDDVTTDFVSNDFTINMEEVSKIRPDVMIIWDYQKKELEQLKALGISTLALKYGTLEDLQQGIKVIGQMLGQEDRAAKLVNSHQESIKYFEAKAKELKDIDKPRVLYLRDEQLKVAGKAAVNTAFIEMAGGENVAKDTPGQWVNVTMEQIIAWNPQIIYMSNFSSFKPEDLYENKLDGQDWNRIDAVKNKRVYKAPEGIYRWDAPSAESHLMIKWMAQIQQPDIFTEYDIEKDIRNFYSDFLNYNLRQEEVDRILQKELNN